VIPASIGKRRIMAYPFDGYWRDIGTISSYFEASLAMARPDPPFWFYSPRWPIYTRTRSLPPSRIIQSEIEDSLLVEGSDITGARIIRSIVGMRSIIRKGATLKEVVMLGADFYEGEELLRGFTSNKNDLTPLGIGRDCIIERAILDKNCRIGDGVVIRAKPEAGDYEGELHWIRDGITIIPRGTVIPAGTEI